MSQHYPGITQSMYRATKATLEPVSTENTLGAQIKHHLSTCLSFVPIQACVVPDFLHVSVLVVVLLVLLVPIVPLRRTAHERKTSPHTYPCRPGQHPPRQSRRSAGTGLRRFERHRRCCLRVWATVGQRRYRQEACRPPEKGRGSGSSHRWWRGYEAIDGACARREREPQGGRGGTHLKHDSFHNFDFIGVFPSVQAWRRATAAPAVSMVCNHVAHNAEQVYAAQSSPNDLLNNIQHSRAPSSPNGEFHLIFGGSGAGCLTLLHPHQSARGPPSHSSNCQRDSPKR